VRFRRAKRPAPGLDWCVVCQRPLGVGQLQEFPDGCVAHGRCFDEATVEQTAQHADPRLSCLVKLGDELATVAQRELS